MSSKTSSTVQRAGSSIVGYAAILAVGVTIVYSSMKTEQHIGRVGSVLGELYSMESRMPFALGACFAVIGIIGLMHAIMRVRASTPSKSMIAEEADGQCFDADEAIARHLARKSQEASEKSPAQVSSAKQQGSIKPQKGAPTGFGRRGI